MVTKEPDFAPDLEWMLQSDQVEETALINLLLVDYYSAVYRLALIYLEDKVEAQQATVAIFSAIVCGRTKLERTPTVRAWLYRQALLELRKHWQGVPFWRKIPRQMPQPRELCETTRMLGRQGQSSGLQAANWSLHFHRKWTAGTEGIESRSTLDLLSPEIKTVAALLSTFELTLEETAYAFGSSENIVRDFWKELLASLEKERSRTVGEQPPTQMWLKDEIDRRWPVLNLADETRLSLQSFIAGSLVHRRLQEHRSITSRELVMGGVALLFVFFLGWLAGIFSPNPQIKSLQTVVITQVVYVSPTPRPSQIAQSTPVAAPPPLTTQSSSFEIVSRMASGQMNSWRTLFLDAVVTSYGPVGYHGLPVVYRNQVWIDRSDADLSASFNPSFDHHRGNVLVLAGPLSGKPDYLRSGQNQNVYEATLLTGLSNTTEIVEGAVDSLALPVIYSGSFPLSNVGLTDLLSGKRPYGVYLHDMIYPPFETPRPSTWENVIVVRSEQIANRDAIVIVCPDGLEGPLARLWVDAMTGLILRWQAYDYRKPDIILFDVAVHSMDIDFTFPQGFFTPHPSWEAGMEWGKFWQPIPFGQPQIDATLSLTAGHRALPMPWKTPPPQFNVSKRMLDFQWQITATQTVSANVFAGGYYLGDLPIWDPWSGYCQRSPDGKRLAFWGVYPGVTPNPGLIWTDLVYPLILHNPRPNDVGEAWVFAFSPDSQKLAFWGCGGNENNCGIYINNLNTDKNVKLLKIELPQFLVWSREGLYLAMGDIDRGYGVRFLVVRTDNGQVVYQEQYRQTPIRMPDEISKIEWLSPLQSPELGIGACAFP